MYWPMNTDEALVDQRKAATKTVSSTRVEKAPRGIILNKSTTTAAMVIGKTQYPNTQTDWKKEIVPPKSCAFTVTTADPNHTAQKTAAKTRLACPAGALNDSKTANAKQTINGPHKSQSFNRLMISLSRSETSTFSDWETPAYPP